MLCTNCNGFYVGCTIRHLHDRIKEHFENINSLMLSSKNLIHRFTSSWSLFIRSLLYCLLILFYCFIIAKPFVLLVFYNVFRSIIYDYVTVDRVSRYLELRNIKYIYIYIYKFILDSLRNQKENLFQLI